MFNALVKNKDYFAVKWKSEDRDVLKRYKAEQFIKIIENSGKLNGFDVDIYFKIIEKMIVFEENNVIVILFDEAEVEIVIE